MGFNQQGASVYFTKQKKTMHKIPIPFMDFLRHVVKGCVPNISKEIATLLQNTSTLITEETSAVTHQISNESPWKLKIYSFSTADSRRHPRLITVS